jgi:predicted Zn-dependent protease
MKHRARIAGGGPAGALLGNTGTMRGGLLTVEREADYVGLYLMARAGYDYPAARDFWRQYGADFGASRYAQWSHPGSLERATNIAATVEEIRRKQASGEPLTPTPARLATSESR